MKLALGEILRISKWHLRRDASIAIAYLPQMAIALVIAGIIYAYRIFPLIKEAGDSPAEYLIAIPVTLLALFPRLHVKIDAETRNRYAVGGLSIETEIMVSLIQAYKRDLFVNAILWFLLSPLFHFGSMLIALIGGVSFVLITSTIKDLPIVLRLLVAGNDRGERLVRPYATESVSDSRGLGRIIAFGIKHNLMWFVIMFAVLALGAEDLLAALTEGQIRKSEWVQKIFALSIIAGSIASAALIDMACGARLTVYRQNPVSFLRFMSKHFRVAMLLGLASLSPLLYCQFWISPFWGILNTTTAGFLLANGILLGMYQPLSSPKLQIMYSVGGVLVAMLFYWNVYIAVASCLVVVMIFAALSRRKYYRSEVRE